MDMKSISLNVKELEIKKRVDELDKDITKLQDFIDKNDSVILEIGNLTSYLKESDPLSAQIVELVSENNANRDTLLFIENAFKKG
jgi:preprotein translocase subunit SecA